MCLDTLLAKQAFQHILAIISRSSLELGTWNLDVRLRNLSRFALSTSALASTLTLPEINFVSGAFVALLEWEKQSGPKISFLVSHSASSSGRLKVLEINQTYKIYYSKCSTRNNQKLYEFLFFFFLSFSFSFSARIWKSSSRSKFWNFRWPFWTNFEWKKAWLVSSSGSWPPVVAARDKSAPNREAVLHNYSSGNIESWLCQREARANSCSLALEPDSTTNEPPLALVSWCWVSLLIVMQHWPVARNKTRKWKRKSLKQQHDDETRREAELKVGKWRRKDPQS